MIQSNRLIVAKRSKKLYRAANAVVAELVPAMYLFKLFLP